MKTLLILTALITLACEAAVQAQPGCGRMAPIYVGGCGYRAPVCYGGGYGGGYGGYGYGGGNWANCTPWGNGNGAVLNGIAGIVAAAAPILTGAMQAGVQSQAIQVASRPQQPQIIYVNSNQ